MEIDNSSASTFRRCPWEYYESFLRNDTGIEPIKAFGESYTPLEFGSRVHELLEEYYSHARAGVRGRAVEEGTRAEIERLPYPEAANPILETEAQMMMEAYKAHYPDEQLDIVDIERTFKVALPELCPQCYSTETVPYPGDMDMYCNNCGNRFNRREHVLIGKMDLIVRNPETHLLDIIDHKSEKRGAKSNLPQKWAVADQASLYIWAAQRIYGEPVGNFYANVLTRQSPAGQIGPSFPERQKLERGPHQLDIAVRDIVIVADEIERYKVIFGDDEWPANRTQCYTFYPCPFYQLHNYGEDVDLILKHKFEPRKEYLNLAGVPIIQ